MLTNQLQILEQSFKYFSKKFYNNNLNENNTIITIQSKGKTKSYGWCTCEIAWYKGKEFSENSDIDIPQYYEINISAEHLNRNFPNILETLLHEMVHLDNIMKGINDCSKKQFHNEEFKKSAERIGLIVEKVKQYGWSNTTLSRGLTEDIDKFILDNKINVSCFDKSRKDKLIKKVIRNNKKVKMICNGCKNIITCDDEINVTCKDCGIEFVKK